MILGIGTDICAISRMANMLQRFGSRLPARLFTAAEQQQASQRPAASLAAFYAKRFAAKEACAKALGSGLETGLSKNRNGVRFLDIAVLTSRDGAPILQLSGGAERRLQDITPSGMVARLHVSLSDEAEQALAFVVIDAASP